MTKTKEQSFGQFVKNKQLVKIKGGLSYHKGNSAPYFSITCDIYEKNTSGVWRDVGGGAAHETILEGKPELADLVALHLSDIDGAPTHAIENGIYHASGAFAGYDRGLGSRYFQDSPEALRIFADHCRITESEAQALISEAAKRFNFPDIKAHLRAAMEAMRPRWKAEADAAIQKYNLDIYGDAWAKSVPAIPDNPHAGKYGLPIKSRPYRCTGCNAVTNRSTNHTGPCAPYCAKCRSTNRHKFAGTEADV